MNANIIQWSCKSNTKENTKAIQKNTKDMNKVQIYAMQIQMGMQREYNNGYGGNANDDTTATPKEIHIIIQSKYKSKCKCNTTALQ